MPWSLKELDVVDSTNDEARALPAWSAVRAEEQRRGRGRFGRSWVSSRGGLWLSAVLPAEGPPDVLRMLPLIAAQAVLTALARWTLPELRLRWPNDILVGSRKLAGLLVERMEGARPVVGIGINVSNDLADAQVALIATRLAEYVRPVPSAREVGESVLASLESAYRLALEQGTGPCLEILARSWGPPRQVTLDLYENSARGWFEGVDESGRLRLRTPAGHTQFFEALHVRQLKEMEG